MRFKRNGDINQYATTTPKTTQKFQKIQLADIKQLIKMAKNRLFSTNGQFYRKKRFSRATL